MRNQRGEPTAMKFLLLMPRAVTPRHSAFQAADFSQKLVTCLVRVPHRLAQAAHMDAGHEEMWRPEEDQIIKLVVMTEGPK